MGDKGVGVIIDERKSHPTSCGLRVMILDGGQGIQQMECCGHSLTLADEKPLLDLGVRNIRGSDPQEDEPGGPSGTA